MGRKAELDLKKFNAKFPKAKHVVFDDLETFEHTKCKPVSIVCDQPYVRNIKSENVSADSKNLVHHKEARNA